MRSFTLEVIYAHLTDKNYRMIPFGIPHLDIQVVGGRRARKFCTTYAHHLSDLGHLIPGLFKAAIGFGKLNGRELFRIKGVYSDWFFPNFKFGVGSANVYTEALLLVYSSVASYDKKIGESYFSKASTIHLLF